METSGFIDDKYLNKSNTQIAASQLSALDLNNIKLDAKHTLLTPEVLEKGEQN